MSAYPRSGQQHRNTLGIGAAPAARQEWTMTAVLPDTDLPERPRPGESAPAAAPRPAPRALDPREPLVRLSALMDPGSVVPLHGNDTSGVVAARGRIDGSRVIAYCTDGTRMGGAMGHEGCQHIVDAIDVALRERAPVIGLWHSGGARLAEGVEALDGVGQVFAAMVRASGRVPQISVVLGAAAGGAADDPGLEKKLPEQRNRAYNVRPLIDGILDEPMEELQAKWAPNIVVGLGRLGGRSVGVVANNPLRLGGCLDSVSAEKASRFVRMCDAFGIPLLVIVDVPGYLPGVGQEWDGVVRRGAKLLHAFAEAVVPRVTLVTRKAYGGAYIAMNSKSLGATAVFAWPDAEIAVMGAKAAVGILHRRKLAAAPVEQREALHAQLAAEHEKVAGGVHRAIELGVVDEVITPAQTRRRLAEALAAAPAGRGSHGNIPL